MYVPVTIAIVLTMAMALIRALKGPTIYDRILALNMFGTVTVMLLSVLSFVVGRPDFLDIAMIYALMNFIGTTAVLKYFRYGHLGGAGDSRAGDSAAGDSAAGDSAAGARPDSEEGR